MPFGFQQLQRSSAAIRMALSALILAGSSAQAHGPDGAANSDYLYVPNRASADVTIIDTGTDRVIGRVGVGNVPHQVTVSAAAGALIASNTEDNSLSIIDLETQQTAATLILDTEPEHMELSPDGMTLAVGNIAAGTVSLIDLQKNVETARIDGFFQPHNLTWNNAGSLVFAANLGANHISVVDTAKAEIIREIPVGDPQMVAYRGSEADADFQGLINVTRSIDGKLGFAAHGESGQLAVIDLDRGELLRNLSVGERPWRAFATPDGKFMVIPRNGDKTVAIVDAVTQQTVATLPGAADMTGVNTDPSGRFAYVISRGDRKLVVLDLTQMRAHGEIALSGSPETGVTAPGSGKLYVALSSSNQVAVIDTATATLTGTIDRVGEEPWGAYMVGAANYCH